MNTSVRYRTLLRTLFGQIMNSRLTPSELRLLSQELRNGHLSDELSYMIDQNLKHFMTVEENDQPSEIVSHIESLTKEYKVNRSSLANIMQSLGGPKVAANTSIRKMVSEFVEVAPLSRARKLIDILESSSEGDPYLAGIASRRK